MNTAYCVPEAYAKREVPEALLRGEVYEPQTLRLMRRHAGAGDIISGGAFIGDFLSALAPALVPGATLHSFEPVPLSHAAAVATIGLNRLRNVSLHPLAVGEQAGQLTLQTTADNGTPMAARARVVDEAMRERTVEAEVARIDDLIDASRRVSILHLDLEGHEWPAILGARRVIEACRPMIVLEAEKAWAVRGYETRLQETFKGLGYRLSGLMERNAFFLPDAAR